MNKKNYFSKLKSAWKFLCKIPYIGIVFRNMKYILLFWFFVVLIPASMFAGFLVGTAYGKHQLQDLVAGNIETVLGNEIPENLNDEVSFEPFWEAWTLLDQKFVGGASAKSTSSAVTDQEKVWGAISGLTASYGDPYTNFLPPEESKLFAEDISGEFTGVGMEIGNRNGFLTVVSPLPGTPAEAAGMLPKDIIIEIDGVDSKNMSANDAVKLIRGPKGEPVVLTVVRGGEGNNLTITIIRDKIEIPTVTTSIEDGVFVIKLYSFSRKSPTLFRDALQEFVKSNQGKLILDLRGNPGGFLEASVSMASWFLPEDKLIVEEDYGGKRENVIHNSKGYNIFTKELRMVVLVNGGSASASEILAGALRDHNRALLVGQTTFGKGSVQELLPLTENTSLKITIAKWLLPSGDWITEEGIHPDITVPVAPEPAEGDEEADLVINEGSDYQLEQAIEVLHRKDFFDIFNQIPEELTAAEVLLNANN